MRTATPATRSDICVVTSIDKQIEKCDIPAQENDSRLRDSSAAHTILGEMNHGYCDREC